LEELSEVAIFSNSQKILKIVLFLF